MQFRRASDDAYADVAEVRAVMDGTEAFLALGTELSGLAARVEAGSEPPEELAAAVAELEDRFGEIEGVGDVSDLLGDVEDALDDADTGEAAVQMQAALAAYADEQAWRERAAAELATQLATLEASIRGTLGVRAQDRLSRDQALFIAACNSHHLDVSLSF
jgi:hypothetical protein